MKKMRFNIFQKIIAFTLITTLVPIIILGYFNYTKMYDETIKHQERLLLETVKNQNRFLLNIFQNMIEKGKIVSQEQSLHKLLKDINNGSESDNSAAAHYLESVYSAGNGIYENIFIAGKNGVVCADAKYGISVGTDLSKLNFYKLAKHGTVAVSDVMESPVSHRPVIVVGIPVVDNKTLEVVGVLAMSLEFNRLAQPLISSKIGETGYSFITNRNGLVLAHPDDELVLNYDLSKQTNGLAEALEKALQGKGTYHYQYKGQEKTMAFSPIEGTSLVLMSTIKDIEVLSRLEKLRNESMVYVLVLAAIAVIIGLIFAKSISKVIKNIQATLASASEGDFTLDIVSKRNDELGDLVGSFNMMKDKLSVLINDIKEMVGKVVMASDAMNNSAVESEKVSEQIAVTINDLAKGATEQAEATQKGAQMVEDISKSIHNIRENSEYSVEGALKVQDTVENGFKAILKQQELMEENKQAALNVGSSINSLADKSNKIGNIIEAISGIAEQTNLLALNAAIEAARAGEHGQGFAVVADEVRKLAEQTSKETQEIIKLINDIQGGTAQTVKEMKQAEIAVNNQEKSVQETEKYFNDIRTAVEDIVQQIQQVAATAQQITANTTEVSSVIANIASVSEETAASTEEAAAASEEQNASIQEISNQAESLLQEANQLLEKVDYFKVNE